MKRTLLLVLSGALSLAAQPPGFGWARPTGWFGVGASAAVNPVATRLNNVGWNIAGGVGVTNEYIGLMVDAMYNEFSLNRRARNQLGADDGRQRFWAFTVDPVFHVNYRGPIDFYVTGGGGVYGQQISFSQRFYSGNFYRDDFVWRNTIYKPGVNGGVGFAYSIGGGPIKIIAEARFHHMFTSGSGTSFVPVTIGVSF